MVRKICLAFISFLLFSVTEKKKQHDIDTFVGQYQISGFNASSDYLTLPGFSCQSVNMNQLVKDIKSLGKQHIVLVCCSAFPGSSRANLKKTKQIVNGLKKCFTILEIPSDVNYTIIPAGEKRAYRMHQDTIINGVKFLKNEFIDEKKISQIPKASQMYFVPYMNRIELYCRKEL